MIVVFTTDILKEIFIRNNEEASLLIISLIASLDESNNDIAETNHPISKIIEIKEIIKNRGDKSEKEIQKLILQCWKANKGSKAKETFDKTLIAENAEDVKEENYKKHEAEKTVVKIIDENPYLSQVEKDAQMILVDKSVKYPNLEPLSERTRWRHYVMAKCKLHILKKLGIISRSN